MTTPLSGKIFHWQGGTCCGKSMYQIRSLYRFTRYEAVNGGAKCRKWGGLGWLGGTQGQQNVTIRYSAYDFLFDFNRNYVPIFYRFRDIAGDLSKVADFDPPTCIGRPRRR